MIWLSFACFVTFWMFVHMEVMDEEARQRRLRRMCEDAEKLEKTPIDAGVGY